MNLPLPGKTCYSCRTIYHPWLSSKQHKLPKVSQTHSSLSLPKGSGNTRSSLFHHYIRHRYCHHVIPLRCGVPCLTLQSLNDHADVLGRRFHAPSPVSVALLEKAMRTLRQIFIKICCHRVINIYRHKTCKGGERMATIAQELLAVLAAPCTSPRASRHRARRARRGGWCGPPRAAGACHLGVPGEDERRGALSARPNDFCLPGKRGGATRQARLAPRPLFAGDLWASAAGWQADERSRRLPPVDCPPPGALPPRSCPRASSPAAVAARP